MTSRFIALCLLFVVCLSVIDLLNERAEAANKNPNDILIVANRSVENSSITVGELRSIFLKQKTHWNNGDKAFPFHAKAGTSLRSAFTKTVLDMDLRQETEYWEAQRVRHAISSPPEFNNLLRAIFRVKGSVGYIFRKDYEKRVGKILLVIPVNR